MEVYDISEENELDTHMSGELPVLEGDEAKNLTLEELGQGQEVLVFHHISKHYDIRIFSMRE